MTDGVCWVFFRREWQLKQQGVMSWLHPLVIFLLILTLFALAVGNEPTLLARLAVAVVWIAALLSLVIGMDGLFKEDFDNGALAQVITASTGLPLWVLVRLFVHWLFGAGMVALLSLLATPLFGLSLSGSVVLGVSVLVGSPMMLMLGAIASALTLTVKNGAVLLPLIALPLQLPVLIFAVGAVERFMMGLSFLPVFALLLAGSILALIIAPWVIAWCLKMAHHS